MYGTSDKGNGKLWKVKKTRIRGNEEEEEEDRRRRRKGLG